MPLSNAQKDATGDIPELFAPELATPAIVRRWSEIPADECRSIKRSVREYLAGRPEMSVDQIAAAHGIKPSIVYSIQRSINNRGREQGSNRQQLTDRKKLIRALKAGISIEDIAKAWIDIATTESGAQKVRALEHISEYLGAHEDRLAVLPIFILPSDASIGVFTAPIVPRETVDQPIAADTTAK